MGLDSELGFLMWVDYQRLRHFMEHLYALEDKDAQL